MRWNFFKGMLLGGVTGAVVSSLLKPQMRNNPRKYLLRKTRSLRQRTGKVISDMAHEVQGLIRR